MGLPDEFRSSAQECFDRAKEAHTPEDRVVWLSMAQWWLRFAEHLDKDGANRGLGQISRRRGGDKEAGSAS